MTRYAIMSRIVIMSFKSSPRGSISINSSIVIKVVQSQTHLSISQPQCSAAKAIEYMLIDALLAAEPHLKIAERINDPKQFLHLTDSIMEDIERSTQPVCYCISANYLN
jgi:hypothetical protein